jgi:predicted secreted hydrolase
MNRILITAVFVLLAKFQTMASTGVWTDDGYRIPPYDPIFDFPRDHGSHPGYKIEWWYLIGHVNDAGGRKYGFQITFFRIATRAWDPESITNPEFDDSQIYMTHVALTDVERGEYHQQERLNRGGWDALSRTDSLYCRNGNWTLEMTDATPGSERMETTVTVGPDIRLELSFGAIKPLVAFGDRRGLSIKGPRREDCSLYLTFPRLSVSGILNRGTEVLRLKGEAWMDHEISSSQLGDDLQGWDWTCIQLENGWELKAYILRDQTGEPSAFSRLIWISPQNELSYLGPDQFAWRAVDEWPSPQTGVLYPSRIEIAAKHPVSGELKKFILTPKIPNQEFVSKQSDITYWEGACDVTDAQSKKLGNAYLELTGYGGSIGTRL